MEELDLKLLQEYTIYDIVRTQDEKAKQIMRTKYYQYLRVFVLPVCQNLTNLGISVYFSKPYGLTIQQMIDELRKICMDNHIEWESIKNKAGNTR